MPSNVVIINVAQASDGTGAQPTGDLRRNDEYFLVKIAERYMQEGNRAQPGFSYRLDRLPGGYRGFEHQRQDSKHIDRYLYGHPNGIFRSLNELYPHFKHLQEHQDARGCTCKLCSKSASGSVTSSDSSRKTEKASSAKFAGVKKARSASKGNTKRRSNDRLPNVNLLSSLSDNMSRKKQVDEEGTPDVYRRLIDRLRDAGPDGAVNEAFADQLSPDWRAGHTILQSLLTEWQSFPKHVPRLGETVLFTRSFEKGINWDAGSRAYYQGNKGRQPVAWEAGVVTQMPISPLSETDLLKVSDDKKHNITLSGFRVEPLSQVGNEYKPFSTQLKYVPLHAIRPFSLWKDCVRTGMEETWHPTIKHALTITNSFCVLGKYSFKGTWPEATLFASSAYIGHELIMLGDTVTLMPLDGKTRITDAMVITAIRMRFVHLDRASDDDHDNGLPYNTVLHISGKAFTIDPRRSFGGIAKTPGRPGQDDLPAGLEAYGQWFHMLDPALPKSRLEVPFHRVLGRCHTASPMRAWLATASGSEPSTKLIDLSSALAGFKEARSYSMDHDKRIKGGKRWFWADTRIEQLDLHELNSKFAGSKDETRFSQQVHAWRQALKVLDGEKGGAEKYYEAREKREEEEERRRDAALGASGLMATGVNAAGHVTGDERTDKEAMEIDSGSGHIYPEKGETIDLVDDDDDEDDESMGEE